MQSLRFFLHYINKTINLHFLSQYLMMNNICIALLKNMFNKEPSSMAELVENQFNRNRISEYAKLIGIILATNFHFCREGIIITNCEDCAVFVVFFASDEVLNSVLCFYIEQNKSKQRYLRGKYGY